MSTDHQPNPRQHVLVTVEELQQLLAGDSSPVVLDVRFVPATGPDREGYDQAHLPGAVFVDLTTELSGTPEGFSGRRPLPGVADLQAAARIWGLGQDQAVVVYDDRGGRSAGRAWWVLRWAGVADVRILDGGLVAWQAAGFPVTTEAPTPAPGDVALVAGGLPVLDADGAAAMAADGLLLDAREAADYRKGHIPGALSAPTSENLDDQGLFADTDRLQQHFAALGVEPGARIGVYCGGGVAAAHEIAAMHAAGIEAAMFPGSWSAWSSDPARPAATGDDPGQPA